MSTSHRAVVGRRTGPILAFFLAIVAIFLSSLPPLLMGFTGTTPRNLAELLVPLYSFLVVWIALALWVRFYERRPFTSIGLEGGGLPAGLLRGVLIVLAMVAITLGPLVALGWLRFAPGSGGVLGVALMLGAFVVQGGAEEVAYRGFLMQAVQARWGAIAGLLVQALAFTLPHLANPKVTPLGVANIVLGGLMFGALALWSRGLWVPIVVHALWNWSQPALFGFNVSGVPMNGFSLLEPRFAGGVPELWSGGEGGMEAMVSGVIAVGLVTAAAWFAWARRARVSQG